MRTLAEAPTNFAIGYVQDVYFAKHVLPETLAETEMVYYLDGMLGDGGVISNVFDVYKFASGIKNGKLLRAETLEKAYTRTEPKEPTLFQYGYGWIIEEIEEVGKVIWHSGGWPGYSTLLKRYVDQDVEIVILRNMEFDFAHDEAVVQAIENAVLGKDYILPASIPPIPQAVILSNQVMEQVCGSYAIAEMELTIDVYIKNNELYIQMPGTMELKLYPYNENLYFIKGLSIDVKFTKVDDTIVVDIIDGVVIQSATKKKQGNFFMNK